MQLFLQSAYLSSAISLVYIVLLYRSHPFRRLPVASIFSTFVVGMLSVVAVVLVQRIMPELRPDGLLGAVVVAPLIEESIKLAFFAATVRRLGYPSLIEPLDYAIYFGTLGVGFAIYEDFAYIFGTTYPSWISGNHNHFIEVFRWMVYARSFPGHVLFNALAGFLIGWGLCQAKGRSRWGWFVGAFLVAVASHGLFNLAATQRGTLLLWSLVVAYLGVFLMLRRRVLTVSPFGAVRQLILGKQASWDFGVTPVEALFAEGFSWPGRTKRRLLAFYPLVLSLVVLFPVLVSCVYFLQRILSIGWRR
ncbi:PrsW family glutamic-type intramembrane protease [Candidatus Bipolaricaulota bacterium]